MEIYFRIDNLHIYDEYFANNYLEITDKVCSFFKERNYGISLEGFYPVLILRNQKYYKMIEEDPSQIKIYQYYPKVRFMRKEKMLVSFVEVHHEEVRNANTVKACEKIVARGILKAIDNANEFAKSNQRIDFEKMAADLMFFYASNGIQF